MGELHFLALLAGLLRPAEALLAMTQVSQNLSAKLSLLFHR